MLWSNSAVSKFRSEDITLLSTSELGAGKLFALSANGCWKYNSCCAKILETIGLVPKEHLGNVLENMAICGSRPNLAVVPIALRAALVFPLRICSIVLPIQVVVFSQPLGTVASR